MSDNWARFSAIWTRRSVIVMIVIGILAIAVPVAIYFSETKDREIRSETIEPAKAAKQLPTVSVSSIYVSTVAMDVPAVFELEIQAGGVSSISVRNMKVFLNFGRARVDACGYSPKLLVTNVVEVDKSHRRFEIAELGQKEKLHIRCIIDSPFFDQIIINGENLGRSYSIDFSDYLDYAADTKKGFWTIWFYIVFSIISGILLFYFFLRLMSSL